jgi:hypothetical protein
MFANNRIDRLNVLIRYDTISIITIKGNKYFGAPDGTNNLKKPKPFLTKPIHNIPIFKLNERPNVTAK